MCCLSVVVLRIELMQVSDSIVRWCGGLCLPLHDLQCAFYLHVVSLGRKLHTHLVCVCNFLRNEGLSNVMLYDRISMMPEWKSLTWTKRTDSREKRKDFTSFAKRRYLYTDSYDDVVSAAHVATR